MAQGDKVRDMMYAGLFAALIAVLGLIFIPLPISPVPISGQSLAVMLAGSILTVRQAAFSVLTFLLVGAAGVPVISGGNGGLGILVGPRGGYLIGFLVGAVVISLLKGTSNQVWRLALANIAGGIAVVYVLGMFWLSFVTGIGLEKALIAGVLPFIPGDLCKVVIATVIGTAVNRRLEKAGQRL
ncbi:MAG: biotin transporter BioY [Veillonellales bacterium]